MRTALDVSIIVVSYNTREMTLACLRSVCEQTKGIAYELIVVDNASKDDSAESIKTQFPAINLIASKDNQGFAVANNLAATKAKGDYLLLLNPDTIVLGGAIQKLLEFAKKKPANLIYGGRTLYKDQTLNPTSCWRRPTLWSLFCYAIGLTSIFRKSALFNPESYGNWQRDSVREVDIVTGCFLMIQKKLWIHLGGFDQQFFMYGEDADLCLRASAKGANPIITPDATIIHYCGASETVRADKMVRLLRAKEQLIRTHWSPFVSHVGLALLRFAVLSRTVACRLLILFMPNKPNKNAESWKEIWQRRKEWQTS
jgi:GT2 family glycosyltransferase